MWINTSTAHVYEYQYSTCVWIPAQYMCMNTTTVHVYEYQLSICVWIPVQSMWMNNSTVLVYEYQYRIQAYESQYSIHVYEYQYSTCVWILVHCTEHVLCLDSKHYYVIGLFVRGQKLYIYMGLSRSLISLQIKLNLLENKMWKTH